MTAVRGRRPLAPRPRGFPRPDNAQSEQSLQLELYKVAVDEYRFQVQLNWDRAKYLLAFNTAIIGAGTGLIKVGGSQARGLVGGLFIVGLAAAAASVCAIYLQHRYYRAARNAMTALAGRMSLGESGVATTPGARGLRTTVVAQIGRVQNMLYVLLTVIAGIDSYGIYYAFSK